MSAETATALLDTSRLEAALGGDRSMMVEILDMYAQTAVDDLEAVVQAVAGGDAPAVVRRAHALKGSSGNVGADRVMALAARIERLGREDRVGEAVDLLADLRSAFEATVDAARDYRAA